MADQTTKKSISIVGAAEANAFVRNLIDKTASHVWHGYGSALFIELGLLTPSTRLRRDGSAGAPKGEFTLMIEWSWRIEGRRYIVCGSWSDDAIWKKRMLLLQNQSVQDISFFGKIPEVQADFGNGARLVSFMTTEYDDGNPAWAVFDNRGLNRKWLSSKAGRFVFAT